MFGPIGAEHYGTLSEIRSCQCDNLFLDVDCFVIEDTGEVVLLSTATRPGALDYWAYYPRQLALGSELREG